MKVRVNSTSKMRFGVHFDVLDVSPDGNSTIQMTYKSASAEMQMTNPAVGQGVFKTRYDSSKPDKASPEMRTVAGLVGGSLTLITSPRVQILDIKGIELLVERIYETPKITVLERKEILENFKEGYKIPGSTDR